MTQCAGTLRGRRKAPIRPSLPPYAVVQRVILARMTPPAQGEADVHKLLVEARLRPLRRPATPLLWAGEGLKLTGATRLRRACGACSAHRGQAGVFLPDAASASPAKVTRIEGLSPIPAIRCRRPCQRVLWATASPARS